VCDGITDVELAVDLIEPLSSFSLSKSLPGRKIRNHFDKASSAEHEGVEGAKPASENCDGKTGDWSRHGMLHPNA
jgi:hypothetical protein